MLNDTKILVKKLWIAIESELEATDERYRSLPNKITHADGITLFVFQRQGKGGRCSIITLGGCAIEPIVKFIIQRFPETVKAVGQLDAMSYVS